MAFNKWFVAAFLVAGVTLGGMAGCGGSRNSSDPSNPADFALGSGQTQAQWSSSSTELVHDLSRGALYYADVENQDIVSIEVASGDDSTLVSLQIGPSKLRLTADSQNLYILESDDSADNTDGLPDLIRYNISGNFVDNSFIELNAGLRVDDFVATNNARIVVAGFQSTTSTVYTSLFLASGSILREASFDGAGFVVQQLALANDQQTLLSSLVRSTNSTLNTVDISADKVDVTNASNLTLAQTAANTYEPDGNRIFRSNGTVVDGNKTIDLGSGYESIDFDRVADRVVILVRGSSGFIIRYFDIDSLDLLSEQTLPAVADAVGMEPEKLFVDDGDLYVVYREVTSALSKDYLLVQFDYPR